MNMDCLNYGKKCANCSKGQQEYCKKRHEKIENGTFNLAQDYWDYIDSMIDDDELEEFL